MARYVVGDIQGCYSGLRRLLDKCQFSPERDSLYAVGDLIGRGAEAKETLDYLLSLGDSFQTVLGNHDLHFLAVHLELAKNKPSNGFEPLLESRHRDEYVHWLRHCPLALAPVSNTLMTHAGLYPHWSIEHALDQATFVSQQLRSQGWQAVLSHMYGDEPRVWSDDLPTKQRNRFIINALTRMRYVTADGALELKTKTSTAQAPKELYPWFKHPEFSLKPGQRVIFGHWAALECKTQNEHVIGLDSGYIWGGSMTALDLDTGQCTRVPHLKG
ncbi:Bis(5'-nucleosyl)-tetraphosphatase (symmetrical) [Saliniradius amylolyticus]|uniref:bis(5'-nucleosyl)-tetraphosphatase (symmetrical) n=1 Tax=Saliniradius amylolyticus TaxID=2183582 RepID=A0A2S2DZX3_9ALTE|nr:symmetrical bis(5'-nucleosyl)-tetraphosphatase [Saliniradius amylolyticus]AWL10941.1 Bis(5'-nucleosyl)-tetraphosphatase (symmetrical) [Saliniradius amylolyticus]